MFSAPLYFKHNMCPGWSGFANLEDRVWFNTLVLQLASMSVDCIAIILIVLCIL